MIDQVVQRCKDGDMPAFSELFEQHGTFVQKTAYRLTRDRELQRDIYQEVVRTVIRHIGSFRGECAFTTWLYRVTTNVAVNQLKRESRHRDALEYETVADPIGDSSRNQLERVQDSELFAFIREVLLSLPEREREVLTMFYLGELAVGEIAVSIGTSSGAVKAILFKGRKKIVKRLRSRGVMDHDDV